jgi:hypothetical protein
VDGAPNRLAHGLNVLGACAQCELDIMFNLEKAHFIVDEMFMNGCLVETNKANVLKPIVLLDKMER